MCLADFLDLQFVWLIMTKVMAQTLGNGQSGLFSE